MLHAPFCSAPQLSHSSHTRLDNRNAFSQYELLHTIMGKEHFNPTARHTLCYFNMGSALLALCTPPSLHHLCSLQASFSRLGIKTHHGHSTALLFYTPAHRHPTRDYAPATRPSHAPLSIRLRFMRFGGRRLQAVAFKKRMKKKGECACINI